MMRGSLDRPKKKSAKENLDRPQTKKSRGGLDSSHSQAKPNHGKELVQQIDTNMVDISPSVQQSDTNMGDISPSHVPSLNKAKGNSSKGSTERMKFKPIRPSVNNAQEPIYAKEKVQESNTNMDVIALPDMLSFDKAKSNSIKGSFERMKLKPIRGSLNRAQSQVEPFYPKEAVQESNTNYDGIALLDMPSLDKAKSNPAIGKLKPIKANINTAKSKVNPLPTFVKERVQQSNTNLDGMALPDMLRFLDEEEALLTQMQSKMSDELSRLQVEEHVFLHTLQILSQKHASSNKVNENQQQSSSEDRELIDALNEALTENGDSMPCSLDKDEETSEE